MNNKFRSTACIAITIFFLFNSCTDKEADQNPILGIYHLKLIETDCFPNSITEHTLIEDNDKICLETTRIDTSGMTMMSSHSITCERIILKESGGGEIIGGSPTYSDTVQISYSIDNDDLELCYENNNCSQYKLVDQQLVIQKQIDHDTSSSCTAIFTYQK